MSSDLANKLSDQTKELVSRFEERVSSFRGRDDLLTLVKPLDKSGADSFARAYFGEGEYTAIGIDGSRAFDERLQMMLFYANATGYSCPFSARDGGLQFELAKARRDAKLSASAAIPLWAEDFSDVLPDMPEIELELEYSMERIPNSFMTLAEIYLATKATDATRIIFMDRPISGTYSTLARDSRLLVKRGSTNLGRFSGHDDAQTLMDLGLFVRLGAPSMVIPRRKKFAAHRVLRELMGGELSVAELSGKLSVDEAQVTRAVKSLRKFDERNGGGLFENAGGGRLKLREGISGYWERSSELARGYAESVFDNGGPPLSAGDDWLTILDVNTMALVLLVRLCEVTLERRTLLIGIAKDTTATDIHRAVLPYAVSKGFVHLLSPPPGLKNDRAFLSMLSAMNRQLETPWRSAGYDAAFSTMVGSVSGGEFRSARKVVSREELFVRGFFQSRSLGSSGKIRSQVFFFDRVFDPAIDEDLVGSVQVKEASGKTGVTPYYEGRGNSPVSNLVLRVLSLTDNPEVYEAFGHNQLLYLADKAVKSEMRLMKSSLRGVAELRVGSMSKREQVYGITTPYREQRAGAEAARMREASRVE